MRICGTRSLRLPVKLLQYGGITQACQPPVNYYKVSLKNIAIDTQLSNWDAVDQEKYNKHG